MNYHRTQPASTKIAQHVAPAVQHKRAADAERIEHLNRLTRYPSLIAVMVTGVALVSAAVHLLR